MFVARAIRVGAALTAVAVFVVACSGSGAETTTTEQPTTSTTAATTTTTVAPTTTTTAPPTTTTTVPEPVPVDDPEAIQRTWLTSEGYYVAYEEDGTWAVSETPDGGPFVTGTYTFEDGLLVEFTDTDSQTCVGRDGGQAGSYEISFRATGDEISMIRTTVEDPCFNRRTDSEGGPWTAPWD